MSGAAELDEVFDAFIEGRADFAHFRSVVEDQLALAPELSGAALLRLDSLRRDGRLSPALHALMTKEVERSSGGDITPPFDDRAAEEPRDAAVQAPPKVEAPKTEAPVVAALHAASHPGAIARDLEVGAVLAGRYRLEALLGRGGMHLVYRAEDLRLGGGGTDAARVAVKLVSPEYAGRAARRGLEWEASMLAGLNHPGVIRVLDFDRDGEVVFLVTELLHGQRLRSLLVRSQPAPLPMDEAMGIIRELAEALAYVHGRGLVHRDVQPANVFITASGGLRLIDFGLAAPIGGSSEAGSPAQRPGTPAYASPEVLGGRPPDPRDDVYSLGCIAYEVLTGRHPWGKAPADDAAHRKLKPSRPPGLREPQWTVLRRALSFKAANRPADAAAFLAAWFPSLQSRRFLPWVAAAVLAAIGIGIGLAIFAPGPAPRPVATPAVTPPPPTLAPVPEREVAEVPPTDAPPDSVAPTDERLLDPPLIEIPTGEAPAPEPPAAQPPAREAPAVEPPVAEAPAAETPASEAPTDAAEPVEPATAEPPAPAPEPAAPPALALEADRFRVVEGRGALRLEMRRPAGYAGSLRVRWRTVERTAIEGEDFMASTGWRWAEAPPGAPSLVIFIPIVNHSLPRPERIFYVELEQVPGGPRVGTPSRAEVRIVSDD
jgi:hypothetical protein